MIHTNKAKMYLIQRQLALKSLSMNSASFNS